MKPEIIDNFLDKKDLNQLQEGMLSEKFQWYFSNSIVHEREKDFQFCHTVYKNGDWGGGYNGLFDPIIEKVDPFSIFRIKANLRTRESEIKESSFHTDIGPALLSDEQKKLWTTSIFYINTNNGYTEFEDGTKIESVANRLATFPANWKHRGTSCTDENIRVVMNFNWFLNETKLEN